MYGILALILWFLHSHIKQYSWVSVLSAVCPNLHWYSVLLVTEDSLTSCKCSPKCGPCKFHALFVLIILDLPRCLILPCKCFQAYHIAIVLVFSFIIVWACSILRYVICVYIYLFNVLKFVQNSMKPYEVKSNYRPNKCLTNTRQRCLNLCDCTSFSLCFFFFIRCEVSGLVTDPWGFSPKLGAEVLQPCDG